MSKWVPCEICGEQKEVPAYEGDGVYHVHICRDDSETGDQLMARRNTHERDEAQ